MLDYFKLLERAYEKIPERTLKSERFEFPEVIVSYYKNRTIIENSKEILDKFSRDFNLFSKFLQKEFGVPVEIERNKIIILKKIDEIKLKKKVEKFFEFFVKCPVCGKPDTKIIKKDRILFLKCEACGAESPIRYVF